MVDGDTQATVLTALRNLQVTLKEERHLELVEWRGTDGTPGRLDEVIEWSPKVSWRPSYRGEPVCRVVMAIRDGDVVLSVSVVIGTSNEHPPLASPPPLTLHYEVGDDPNRGHANDLSVAAIDVLHYIEGQRGARV